MNRSGTVAAIRAEAGNLRYEYCQPLDDPETILLIGSWKNQESIDIHHASVFQKIFHLTTKRFAHTKQSTIICDQFTPEDPSFGEALTVLLTQDREGKVSRRGITQEQLGEIFFGEGNRQWDQVHMMLPEPVWEKLYDHDGYLVYEGYTVDHRAFGAGRSFFRDGSVCMEGVFGIKGLLSGRAYYPDGLIRFEGYFRINNGYGPNFPEYGTWYGRDGKMLYRGKFVVSRSTLGWPSVYKPEGFGPVPRCVLKYENLFMWEHAKKWIKGDGDHEADKA